MELIRVNSLKLKIILTPGDMQEFDITNETLDYASAKTRKAFRTILDRAKQETGFDTKNDHIYVQVFPSVDGGCELFLTRRGRLLPEADDRKSGLLKKKYTLPYDIRSEEHKYIAKTQSIENVISLCIRMKEADFSGCSSLYCEGDKYYLTVKFPKRLPSFVKDSDVWEDNSRQFAFMSEYAEISYADELTTEFIKEHAKRLCSDNAVEVLAENFGQTQAGQDEEYGQDGI